MEKLANKGDKVIIHYVGTVDNGAIFDSCDDETPMLVTLGNNEIFPALEAEIIGMKRNEIKNILIKAADAYGPRLTDNTMVVERKLFPPHETVEVGKKLAIKFADGEERVMLVIKVNDETVTLDGNHPLAGLDLTFALKLADILS
ncbi:FKBP-type peptidyl-prolyl cis-trans isomerase 2 [Desulfuromusa kysingii]|uniref:Peptidyl-prolyl cis-trans isomerase n=1 Tax=Desulfuromusa kysingii TaxID=37625 RepID=A0A1H4DJC5_9BACT|nr:FKBP-type peptidyl-prolyl cis-trans isomerase [Desulfuromusa kysingii]SEA72646.1 FKBP-type peptidyl-prolyl cis-trans isomerase 2 [Desulfuromusa kysingii]